jgi:hypothetical protein
VARFVSAQATFLNLGNATRPGADCDLIRRPPGGHAVQSKPPQEHDHGSGQTGDAECQDPNFFTSERGGWIHLQTPKTLDRKSETF